MGYADPDQVGTGLRQRLFSRAFIVGDVQIPSDRFVYLVLDTQSGDTAVRNGILEALSQLGPKYSMYGKDNVAVTGTHSHSGPGAWLNYLLPQITSKGFNKQSYQAIVDGALLSIIRAHERLAPGYLLIGHVEVDGGNINRSPYAYLANPASERSKYEHDVDKTMTLLHFESAESGKAVGALTWFAVHGTSMYGNNTLITGDNKGVAANLLEKDLRSDSSAESTFVAGFSQSNVGDTSPNVLGAYCESGPDAGKKCSFENSTCAGRSQACHGRGPFYEADDTGTASCYEIGRRQYLAAKKLYHSMLDDPSASKTPIRGNSVKSFHRFTSFSNYTFPLPNGSLASTCPAALGYSFAAGTTDGPGAFDFTQNNPGDPTANPLWSVVRRFIKEPDERQKACHAPKPILLDVGEIDRPYAWTPNIVDIQVLRVGQLFIIVSPGEATTMAGRRWRDAVRQKASSILSDVKAGGSGEEEDYREKPIVLLGGPANTYTHYIATPEEYGVQRYEGASTLYGPHTLDAFIHRTVSLLPFLNHSSSPPPSPPPPSHPPSSPNHAPEPTPPINTNKSLSFITPVIVDRPGFFRSFGDVLHGPDAIEKVNEKLKVNEIGRLSYHPGQTVKVTFVAANPRNNLRLEGSYVTVEKKRRAELRDMNAETATAAATDDNDNGNNDSNNTDAKRRENKEEWHTIRDDSDWDLWFRWRRTSTVLGTSEVDVYWEIGGGDTAAAAAATSGSSSAAGNSDDAKGNAVNGIQAGIYRIKYFGDAKRIGGGGDVEAFEGVSEAFRVVVVP